MLSIEETDPAKTISEQLTPRYQYYLRLLLTFTASGALIAHGANSTAGLTNQVYLIALALLVYTGFAYWLTVFSKEQEKPNALSWLSILDGFLITLAISEFEYNPWPSILLACLLQFGALSQGGFKQWLEVNVGGLFGLLVGFFALGNQDIQLAQVTSLNIIVLICTFTYLCLYAANTHQFLTKLMRNNRRLEHDRETFRNHAYKLSRYLPGPVTAMMRGKTVNLKTERKRITVFFSDIVGFTELSEELEAETLSEVLNSYLSEMSRIANKYHGTVDKFMGDAIMVIFGDDPETSQGVKKDAINCVSMAIAMMKRMHELQAHWDEMGINRPLRIRIGINSGYCTVGTFGTNKNLDYTALGANVNLASRLESGGSPGTILVSHETMSLVKDVILCRDTGQIKAKGFSYPIHTYEVIDHRKDLGGKQSFISENMDGFSMHLDMEKIKNYDKDKLLDILNKTAEKLRNKRIH